VVLLIGLEDDVLGLRMGLQRRVEDLLLDDLVKGQLALDRREQLRSRLDTAFRRGLEFVEQPLDLPALIGLALIICGVVVVNAFSQSLPH